MPRIAQDGGVVLRVIRSSVSHNGTVDGMDEDGISLVENRYSVHQFKGKEMLEATDQSRV